MPPFEDEEDLDEDEDEVETVLETDIEDEVLEIDDFDGDAVLADILELDSCVEDVLDDEDMASGLSS